MDQKILEIKKKELREILACTNKEQREKWLREYALEEGRRIGKEEGYADYLLEVYAEKFVEGYLIGIEIGIKKGRVEDCEDFNKEYVLKLNKLGVSLEKISLYLDISIEECRRTLVT